jgi:peptide/nickel transport system substrate-binding protein
MRSRLLFSAACVAAAALALGGDAAGHSRGIETGGTFRVGVVQQGGPIFTGVDPALSIDTAGLLRPACGSLMAYPDAQLPKGLVLVPELAEKAPSVTNDGETYTFTIRRDAYFSTGAHVTARDVVHTLERILNPKVRSGIAPDFSDIVGARKMLAGKARSLSGAVANGRSLTLRLTGPLPDLPARMSELCIVPATLPPDPEGAKAPLPSAAPYYISEYAPGERVVLVRNRFYRGKRPQHVDEFDIDLAADFETLVDQVASGKVQYAPGGAWMASHVQWLVKHYGVNKSQFLAVPGLETHLFVLNTSRPLFRNNASLRRAINFAVDRRTLVATEHGAVAETPSDTYIPEAASSAGAERVYPFRPDLRRARSLARGHLRSGRAVLYTCTDPDCIVPAQVLQQDLK